MFGTMKFDHVGIRVTDIDQAVDFYAKLGFIVDPAEDQPQFYAKGLVNATGLRIHLIYNGLKPEGGNVLMDVAEKWPGYTHAAFVIDDMDHLVTWFGEEGIEITEGPSVYGHGRRKVCFIRDPDRNVLEFNEIL